MCSACRYQSTVTAGTVFNAEICVQLLGAYDNRVQGVTVGNCLVAVTEAPAGASSEGSAAADTDTAS